MAPLRPAAKAPTAQNFEVLKTAHDGLRTANEQLQGLEREICRLMTVKMIYFPSQCESSDRLQRHEQGDFGDQLLFEPEWLRWAAHNGLFESVDNLGRELEKISTSKTKLDSIQGALRCCINELSRPYLRDLNILDLPDELLLEIFELVEDFDFDSRFLYYDGPGRKDIKNTRLVCRRFCDVSSQLLVRLVRVNFDEPSLARLDEISRNHNIARGVRAVRVVLHFYNSSFTDLDWFISYQADELEGQVDMFDGAKLWKVLNTTDEQTASQMIANGRAVVSRLRRLASADPDDGGYSEDDHDRRVRLDEVHKEYLILLEKQESLIRSGKFSEIVSSAIARMPGARKLEFSDWDFESMRERALMIPGGDVWSALHRLVLQPMTGYEAKKHGFELPNYQCVVNVIDAARSAGALLNRIDITLSTVGYPGALVPAPDIRQEFSSGMQQLKEFKFSCKDSLNEQDVEDLNEFLSACLDTSSLQKLSLDMRGEGDETARIDVGRVMGSKSRKELTDIFLGQIAIDLSMLVRLLERLPEPIRCLHQYNVRLLSGTWKEALDALREKRSRVMLFRTPQGAECDNMSREDYERIFGEDGYGNRSEAELYITNRRLLEANPLRALEGGLYTEN
ncbi:hypothetical protein C8A00DRAFT_42643 [Chaetomidium leptoderma]|uniref:F-box domain-containing protein n=1 Tax=Chaetomidium leptoderma TaxID=669021 RepID=A0AAN6VNL1_9PEZI|nr:hypothetical protein C8A00DRAFT_42643 [Chaetomidium leptoderma]